MDNVCGNCKYWHMAEEVCRRKAPVPSIGGHCPPDSDPRWSCIFDAFWPHTEEHAWCGEHEPEK